jgi:hypothetical protein
MLKEGSVESTEDERAKSEIRRIIAAPGKFEAETVASTAEK